MGSVTKLRSNGADRDIRRALYGLGSTCCASAAVLPVAAKADTNANTILTDILLLLLLLSQMNSTRQVGAVSHSGWLRTMANGLILSIKA